MSFLIQSDEKVRRVVVTHKCLDGGSNYNGFYDEANSQDIMWGSGNRRYCFYCGEKYPISLDDLEKLGILKK